MNRTVLTLMLVALALTSGAQGKFERRKSTYTDGLYGFSIQAPKFPEAAAGSNVIPVMLLGPGEGGFSSNVNVVVQQVKQTREQFRKVSLGQFQAAALKVTSDQNKTVSGKEAIFLDYEGRQQGRDLRFLALAVFDSNRVFLVTCTAPQKDFPKFDKEFRACIDSFAVEQ